MKMFDVDSTVYVNVLKYSPKNIYINSADFWNTTKSFSTLITISNNCPVKSVVDKPSAKRFLDAK